LNAETDNQEQLLKEGKILPVMEEFYTLQGEGFHSGKAAYFIRIGGCDVTCSWCDVKESWDASRFPPLPVGEIVNRAAEFPARSAVITGGEPLLYNLDLLCRSLREKHIQTFLETSGSSPFSGAWDWICLSPKKDSPPLDELMQRADELKVVIAGAEDFGWAEENSKRVRPECLLYLQPEWCNRRSVMPLIVNYIQSNPTWRISLQSHKYIGIP